MKALEQSQKFFDERAAYWDDGCDNEKFLRIKSLLIQHSIQLISPFLDLGSGTGILIPLLKSMSKNGETLIECDISWNMLIQAKQKHTWQNHIHYIQGDAHSLPFPADHFGSVICFSVFPHFHQPGQAIAEIHRILHSGGNLVILHLMGHKQLNELHRQAGEAVKRHRLPAAIDLAQELRQVRFRINRLAEEADLYLIVAEKI